MWDIPRVPGRRGVVGERKDTFASDRRSDSPRGPETLGRP